MTELVKLLKERGMHIAFAESCTGGLLSEMLTSVPGASEVFYCGIVSYCNEIKKEVLGVCPQTIANHTEVSFECAEEMALGAAKIGHAEIALSVTGYAGPTGGSEANPVGTVYIGLFLSGKTYSKRFHFSGTRDEVRAAAADAAVKMAKDAISG